MSYLASVCTRFHGEFTNPSPSPRFCQTFADDSPTASNISVGKVGGGGGGISPPLFLPFDRGCKISLPSNRGRVKGGIYEGKFQFRNSSLFLSCFDRIRRSRAINKGESRRFSRDLSIKISIKKWAEVAVRLDRFQVSIIRDPSPLSRADASSTKPRSFSITSPLLQGIAIRERRCEAWRDGSFRDRKCVLIKIKLIDKFIILANNNLNFNIIIIFLSLNRLYILFTI